jgi:hypothetical protein
MPVQLHLIYLNCSGGAVDSYANVYATLTDTVTPGMYLTYYH